MIRLGKLKTLTFKAMLMSAVLSIAADGRTVVAQEAQEGTERAADNSQPSHEYPSNLEELKGQIFKLQAELAVMAQELGPDHPKMKQAQTRLAVFGKLYQEYEASRSDEAKVLDARQSTRVLTLRHIAADNIERMIRELYPVEKCSIVADTKTNTLILRAEPEFAEIVQALIERLEDTAAAKATSEPNADPFGQSNGVGSSESKEETKPATAASVTQMRQEISDLDQHVQRFANDVRNHVESGKGNAEELEKLKGQLRDAVAQSFEARQQLKRTELELMEARLKQLQASIELREQLASKLIDRRVEELLNGKEQAKSDDALAKP